MSFLRKIYWIHIEAVSHSIDLTRSLARSLSLSKFDHENEKIVDRAIERERGLVTQREWQ